MAKLDHLRFHDAALLEYAKSYQDVSNDDTLMWRYSSGYNWLYIKQASDYRGDVLVSTHLTVSFTQGNERYVVNKVPYVCCVSCMVEEAFRIAYTVHQIVFPKEPLKSNPNSPWARHADHGPTA